MDGAGLLVFVALVATCSGASKQQVFADSKSDACANADALLTEAAALQTEGYLGRALPLIEKAVELCTSQTARKAHADALAELWIDGSVVNEKDATADETAQARLLYQAGQILRERDESFDDALERFEESYAKWPHPLTIVQMGLTHRAAGREREYRMHNARALAVTANRGRGDARPVLRRGHLSEVRNVMFHPHLPVLASASPDDGTIILWDLTSSRPRRTFGGSGQEWFVSVAISPDGQTLATGNGLGVVKLWDVASGVLLRTLIGHEGPCESVTFSPDGAHLASTGRGESGLIVWDLESGEGRMNSWLPRTTSAVFSPDGTTIALPTGGHITLWNTTSDEYVQLPSTHSAAIRTIAFSPDGTKLASNSQDAIKLWDVASKTEIRTIADEGHYMLSVAFSPDGTQLASAGSHHLVKLWDVASGTELRAFTSRDDMTSSIAFSPDGVRLVAGGLDGAIEVWEVESGTRDRVLSGSGSPVRLVTFDTSGTQLAVSADNERVNLWALAASRGMHSLAAGGDSMNPVAFSPDGTRFASARWKTIELRDTAGGNELRTLAEHSGTVNSLVFSPDGTLLASSGYGETVITLSDVASGIALHTLAGLEPSTISLAFSPDGTQLASAGDGHGASFKLWDVSSGDEIRTLSNDGYFESVAFSPDGTQLATGADTTINLWDLASGRDPRALVPADESITSPAAFGPDGATLAAGANNSVVVWDLHTDAKARALDGHSDMVVSVAFSPNGALLASGSLDQTVKLWDLDSGNALATLFGVVSGDWVVTTPDGRVDGSPGDDGGASLIYWQIGDVQLPGFVGWQRYYTPGLLAEVMSASTPIPPADADTR